MSTQLDPLVQRILDAFNSRSPDQLDPLLTDDVVLLRAGEKAHGRDEFKAVLARVLRAFPDKGTVLVEHVRVIKKTVSSKSGQRTKGGIAEQESPIQVSNVALLCPTCGVAKVGFKTEGTTRQRVCKKCGTELPTKK